MRGVAVHIHFHLTGDQQLPFDVLEKQKGRKVGAKDKPRKSAFGMHKAKAQINSIDKLG